MSVFFTSSNKYNKRFIAHFKNENGEFILIHFGKTNELAYIDHLCETKKNIWLDNNFIYNSTFMSEKTLCKYILWNKDTISESIDSYKTIFNLS
jgi:hypothetical protein